MSNELDLWLLIALEVINAYVFMGTLDDRSRFQRAGWMHWYYLLLTASAVTFLAGFVVIMFYVKEMP